MSEALAYEDDPAEEAAPKRQPRQPWLQSAPQSPNLAFDIEDTELAKIGAKVCEEYELDCASRAAEGYDERIKKALELSKLASERKAYPWDGASNVKFPLIIQAAVQFNARSYPAVVDGSNVVKGKVLGRPDEEKRDRADRIGRHMSYQLLEEMKEWEEETDELLLRLPVVGTLIRKTYFDPVKGRNCSHIIGPDKFVVNYWTRDLGSCPRGTHELTFYPNEVKERQRAGLWREFDLGDAPGSEGDEQAPHTFLEQFRLIDLDGDDYPEPYTVTVHKETQAVARIVARWYPEGVEQDQKGQVVRITPYDCYTKYGFIPSPDGSFYDLGFGTLLGPLSDTINTTINQLMDAGTLSNLQSGFIGEGVSIKSGNLRFKPGEWKKTGSAGGTIRDAIVPLPTKEPSAVLFNLMQFLLEAAKDLTATQEILTGDAGKANAPVGTTLALIEQGLKTFTAIVKRIHRSLKGELGIIYQLNARYLEPEVYFNFQDEEGVVSLQDYQMGDADVVPVSDPSMATDMQKMGRVQFMLGMRGAGLDDMEINKFALETAGIPDIDRFAPKGPPPMPPEVLKAQAQAVLQERKLDIEERKSEAEIVLTSAQAQKTMLESVMMAPEFQLQVAQLAHQIAEKIAGGDNGGQPPMGPQGFSGMEGSPPEPGVPTVPQGPAGSPDGAMGLGPADGPAGPMQGPPDGGAFGPGMA